MLAVGYDVSDHPANLRIGEDDDDHETPRANDDDDTNKSSFDLTIDSVDVTLSLWRWLDGKGLVENAVVRGVRGVLGMWFFATRNILPHAFQIAVRYIGTQKNPWIPPPFATRLCQEIFTLSRCRWKIS